LQHTCSIFNNNDVIATKKQHQEIYKNSIKGLDDFTEIYNKPNDRFSYRAHLIEDAQQEIHNKNAEEAEELRINNLEKKNRIINSQINKNQSMLLNKIANQNGHDQNIGDLSKATNLLEARQASYKSKP